MSGRRTVTGLPGRIARQQESAEGVMDRPDWSALDGMLQDLKRTVSGLPELHERMLAVTGEAWSEDRMVRALVGPRGHLLELDIDPRVYRAPDSNALAATVVATVRAAVEDASRQTEQILRDGVPSDLRPREVGGIDLNRILSSHDADLRREKGEHHE